MTGKSSSLSPVQRFWVRVEPIEAGGTAMLMGFMSDSRGSAVQWFAVAAVVLSAASMAGAHGLAWLTQDGHLSIVAVRTAPEAMQRTAAGIDTTPTGSIKPKTLMIQLH